MQVYLGEYPGSRINPTKKFLRAVDSFVDQSDKESELVIVSDGCKRTHSLYNKHYKENQRIKYAYVSKNTPNMYEISNDVKYYRGLPREIGRTIATGDVITYMDSDDFLMPDSIERLKEKWNLAFLHNKKILINTSWYYNYKVDIPNINKLEELKINKLPSKWAKISISPGFRNNSSVCLSHVPEVQIKWQDSIGDSEDGIFYNKLLETYASKGEIATIECPYYVVCHFKNEWDY